MKPERVSWHQSECNENGIAADVYGYDLEVSPEKDGSFWWAVRVTAEISEWPEVYAAGFAVSLKLGKKLAEEAYHRAVARRGAEGEEAGGVR